jgi:hypothetical protein
MTKDTNSSFFAAISSQPSIPNLPKFTILETLTRIGAGDAFSLAKPNFLRLQYLRSHPMEQQAVSGVPELHWRQQ